MSNTTKVVIVAAVMLTIPLWLRCCLALAQPACTPVVYTFTLNATDAELTQGDIAYIPARVRDLDGKFGGDLSLAGDRDMPIVQYLASKNHKTLTVTFCAD